MLMRPLLRSSRGFTLIETLAALMVFTIVTLGVIPLLTASLRGTNLSRSHNVAKNIAVRAMERVRGLPFHVAYETEPGDVDVLDLYHPGATNPATTVCPAAGTPECPQDLPNGYTLTYVATFVGSDGVTATPATSLVGYNTNAVNVDEPPASLLRMQITVAWDTVAGLARDYSMTTLIGDRVFGRLKTKGTAKVDYGIRVGTSFSGPDRTDLTALGGTSLSSTEVRTNGAADQTVRVGELTLLDADDGTVVDSGNGAVVDAHAPPTLNVADTTAAGTIVTAPGVGDVAGLDTTEAGDPEPDGNVRVAVASELPSANGGFEFNVGGSSVLDFWVDNPQADRIANPDDTLHLQSGAKLLSISTLDSPTSPNAAAASLSGFTSSEAEDEDDGVHSYAEMNIETLRLLPTDFIGAVDNTYGGAVIAIDDFRATMSCDAYADTTAGTGDAEIEWSATLHYWRDTIPENGPVTGEYVAVPLSGTGGDSLSAIAQGIDNPLVYDAPSDGDPTTVDEERDIYLFPTETNPGYLQTWASDNDVADGADISDDGRTATASLEGALQIDTAQIPATTGFDEFAMSVTIGSMSCEAVDFR